MTTFAVAVVKDEADVIRSTISRMIQQVDRVLVADNCSTDGTREILDRLDIDVIDDPERGHYQSRKVTALAMQALERGADWVVPFDADEVWLAKRTRIADTLADLPADALIAEATVFNHVAVDAPGLSPWRPAQALPLRKVACRVRSDLVIEDGNHGAHFSDCPVPLRATGLLEVRHFPYRTAQQMIRKTRKGAAAFAAAPDIPEDVGKHWRDHDKLTDEQLRDVFLEHYFSADPEADGFVLDPLP